MKKLTLLGDLTPAQFLHEYWHKKPLLIRQAARRIIQTGIRRRRRIAPAHAL
jgi:ribosomal protein L16 Arg81 hydroxylase